MKDRGFFVSGDASVSVDTIHLTVMSTEGACVVSRDVASGLELLVSAVNALTWAITFKSIMFVSRAIEELMFLSGVFSATDAAHNSVLGVPTTLCGVA
jgi:hypothetical protein